MPNDEIPEDPHASDSMPNRGALSGEASLRQRLEHLLNSREAHLEVAQRMANADSGAIFPQDLIANAVIYRSLNLLDGFSALVERKNLLCGGALLRLQLDSLMRFYALNLVASSEPLITALLEGTPLSKIKDSAGRPLTDKHLRDEITKVYPFVGPVYEKTSGFIHLSSPHMLSQARGVDEDSRAIRFVLPVSGNQDWKPEEFFDTVDAFTAATHALLELCHNWRRRKEIVAAERELRERS